MEKTAIDMGEPGFDFDSGFGLIQADRAVAAVVPEPSSVLSLLALGAAFSSSWLLRKCDR
ncbi:MAG: PEP-CTERM sorting domain-containing protein [Coleofasciculus chthonoplastes F3-SA18-01]